jgi:hypothetical protein
MLDWMRRRRSTASTQREPLAEPAKPPGRAMSGQYRLLYKYLENRYATTVVLTFGEIEDLLGFTLPEEARLSRKWWTDAETNGAGSSYADSWVLASRTAMPNMLAQTVVFERTS